MHNGQFGAIVMRRASGSESGCAPRLRAARHHLLKHLVVPDMADSCELSHTVTRSSMDPFAIGGYSDVFWGEQHAGDGKPPVKVAIKVFRESAMDDDGRQKFASRIKLETDVWASLHHKNILRFIGTTVTKGIASVPSLVSPYCKNGNAVMYLRKNPAVDRIDLLLQVADALQYMHAKQPPIVHGDLKGNNIIISDDGAPLLADFGLSRIWSETGPPTGLTTSTIGGSVRFMAPELVNPGDAGTNPRITPQSDVYSFGSVCLELLSGHPPYFQIHSPAQVMLAVSKGITPPRPHDSDAPAITNGVWAVLQACWARQPSARPAIARAKADLQKASGKSKYTSTASLLRSVISRGPPALYTASPESAGTPAFRREGAISTSSLSTPPKPTANDPQEPRPGSFNVRVSTLSGTTRTINAHPTMTIDELKERIQAATGVPASEQRLIYHGKQLRDDTTVRASELKADSSIHLVTRVSGRLAREPYRTTEISVVIRSADGDRIAITVPSWAKISDVKYAIQQKRGIPVAEQQLLRSGLSLEDTDPVGQQRAGDFLHLVSNIVLFAEELPLGSGHHVVLNVESSQTVTACKQEIEKSVGIPASHLNLFFGGEELDDQATLLSYNIFSRSTVYYLVQLVTEPLLLTITAAGQMPVEVRFLASATVLEVKHELRKVVNIDPADQRLFYANTELDDSSTLASSGIVKSCDLLLVVRLQGGRDVFVQTSTGEEIVIHVAEYHTVLDLRNMVAEKRPQLDVFDKRLISATGTTADSKLIADYDLPDETTMFHLVGYMTVVAAVLQQDEGGETVLLELQSDTTVGELREELAARIGFPAEMLRLVFWGNEIDDESPLFSYGIFDGATVHYHANFDD